MRQAPARFVVELERDPALRWYGVALGLAHLVVFFHWTFRQTAARLLSLEATPVCWPFFEGCAAWRGLSVEQLRGVLFGYAALALVVVVAFAARRLAWAYWLSWVIATLHVAITLQDYRLRLNQHYMLLWVGLVFLLAARKRLVLKALLVAFYFWAALLKLNVDWFSGQALGGALPLLVPRSWLPAACAYVVALELLLGFGLFSRRSWLFWGTLLQLGLFHAVSFSVVGFFYPVLMALLLSLFVLGRFWTEPAPAEGERRWRSVVVTASAFSLFQLWPLTFPGDPAITGQGRALSLHMFDAKVACSAVATLHFRDRASQSMAMKSRLPGRIACDPLVYFHFARAACAEQTRDSSFRDLDWTLDSRRGATGPVVRVVDLRGFCRSQTHYSALFANPWIKSAAAP